MLELIKIVDDGDDSSDAKWMIIGLPGCCRKGAALLIIVALLALQSVGFAATDSPVPPSKPNIILILADDLGYGDLGCYGQTKIKTPNIDKLAAEGMRFTDCYAGDTVCAPSRATLMLGLHTGHNPIRGNSSKALAEQDVTAAQILKEAGYHTALIGKWGLGNPGSTGVPQKKGFDEFVGYLNQVHAHDYYTDHLFRYDPTTGFDGRMELPENRNGKKGVYTPDLFTTAALNFVRLNGQSGEKQTKPFFLFLSYIIPHANDEEGHRTGNGMQVPTDAPYSNESWPQVEKNKAAMITRMDRDIGILMDRLQKLKLDSNTLVIFASDNGPHQEGGVHPEFFNSSGAFRGIKRDLYEGGIRVPFIARWAGQIKPGQTSGEICAFWDFLPTVADLAGAKPPAKIDGISIAPTLLGKPQTQHHDFLYWEFHERGFQQAIRMGDWKAVRPQAGEPLELYNLKTDAAEKTDAAAAHPDVVAKMESAFKTARTDDPDWPITKPGEAKSGAKKATGKRKASNPKL